MQEIKTVPRKEKLITLYKYKIINNNNYNNISYFLCKRIKYHNINIFNLEIVLLTILFLPSIVKYIKYDIF